MADDIRSELHDSVDAAVDAQSEKDAAEARLRSIEDRLDRPSPQPDLSGFVTREDLDSKFSELTTLIGGLVTPAPAASTETAIGSDDGDEEDDEEEEAPKVVTQMTTKAEIEERPPRSSHFLFRRLGGR